MLEIEVPESEFFDQRTNTFPKIKPTIVKMEHSLISVGKWEAIWHIPYLPVKGKVKGITGKEQEISYIECMIIGKVDSLLPPLLWQNYRALIWEYISNEQTATTIMRRGQQVPNQEIITVEVIYYWMTKFNVPFECEKWHLTRLLKLLEVCGIKETPAKKNRVSRREAINEIYRLNKQRRAAQQS